jgi:hypothetical protein
MLIEFRIQLDGNGGATVVQTQANPNPSLSSQQQLPAAYVAPPAAAQNAALRARPGGDAPLGDGGTGLPPGAPCSGPGMVFVLGPIVICGPGPGQTGPGGDAPLGDGGTGLPPTNNAATVQNNNPPAAKAAYARTRRPVRKR